MNNAMHIVEWFAYNTYVIRLRYGYTDAAEKMYAAIERARWMKPENYAKL